MKALADRTTFFDAKTNPTGVAYAETVLRITLNGVLTERAYFETLEPHLVLSLLQSTASVEEVVRATDRKVDEVLALLAARQAAPSVSEREVRGILRAFDVAGVDVEDAVDAILAKAQEYQALKDRLDHHADTRTQAALREVRKALDQGELSEAMDRLHGLINEDEDREERSIRVTLEIIEYYATLLSFMLRHDLAAQAYFQASAVAATVNGKKSYDYSMLQADELLEHALRSPDVAAYQAVVSLFGSILPRFKPDSEASVATITHMISAMGQMAERIETPRAVAALKIVLEMEEIVKPRSDETWFQELWAGVQSDIAAMQNNLAARADDGDNGLARCLDAERRLREALAICEKHQLTKLRTVQTNLATTLRNLGCHHHHDEAQIQAAIVQRKRSMSTLTGDDIRDRSNAYDSLGSDFKALASVQGWTDPTTILSALQAYRTGLRTRKAASFIVDVSRSHRNIGWLYAMRSSSEERDRLIRSLKFARIHFGKSLLGLDSVKSPGDWFGAIRAWIRMSLALNEETPLDTADMLLLGARIGDLLDASVNQDDFPGLFESLTDALSMIAVMLEDGRAEMAPIAGRYGDVLERMMPALEYSPIGPHSSGGDGRRGSAQHCCDSPSRLGFPGLGHEQLDFLCRPRLAVVGEGVAHGRRIRAVDILEDRRYAKISPVSTADASHCRTVLWPMKGYFRVSAPNTSLGGLDGPWRWWLSASARRVFVVVTSAFRIVWPTLSQQIDDIGDGPCHDTSETAPIERRARGPSVYPLSAKRSLIRSASALTGSSLRWA